MKCYVAEEGSVEVERRIGAARAVGTAVVTRAELTAALAKGAGVGLVTREAALKALDAFNKDWEAGFRHGRRRSHDETVRLARIRVNLAG